MRELTPEEIHRIYGPWNSPSPSDVTAFFDGYPGMWWIAGGWALEAFTGVARPHGDIDPSIPRRDLPGLRRHMAGRADLWAADQENLTLLLPSDADDDLEPRCENVWTRPSGADPWELDIILMATDGDRWVFKRDPRISLPLESIVWQKDEVPYLRPEIQLLHKARGLRPKDQQDFESVLPLLQERHRAWLRRAISIAHPGHPWLESL